nr:substrate-binding domain-containing protein [Tessaracoccus coleopterorum]
MERRLFIKINGIAIAAAVGLTACVDDTTPTAPGSSSSAGGAGGDKKFNIAVVPKDSTNPWFVRMEVGVKRFAESSGFNVYQKGPAETDATQQAQVIRDLIAQKVDALCVVPVDPGALEPVLKEAMDAGITVITHEGASQENTLYDLEAFNNSAYGGFIMDNLAEAMGEEGVYTTMVGHVTNASHNEWADGGVAHAKEKYPNLKLLEAEPRVESQDDGEVAYQKAKELLKKYPELKGIMGTSSFDAPASPVRSRSSACRARSSPRVPECLRPTRRSSRRASCTPSRCGIRPMRARRWPPWRSRCSRARRSRPRSTWPSPATKRSSSPRAATRCSRVQAGS